MIGFLRTLPSRAPVALQTRKTTEIPTVLSFFFSCFLRVWVTVAFAAPQGRRIVGHHIPATVDPLELCSGSRELPNHGGSYALSLYIYAFSFLFFLGVHLALPFYAYDASVGPL